MMRKVASLVGLGAFFAHVAFAQVAVPTGFIINAIATTTPTATTTSAQTNLSSVPTVYAVNQGLVQVCAAWGASPVASYPCDPQYRIAPGQSAMFPVLGAAKIALVTASGTAAVQLTEGYLAPEPSTTPPAGTVTSNQGTPAAVGNAWPVVLSSLYPSGATPITASATGTTGAVTATLAGTSGKTTYICGFTITSTASSGTTGTATITGTITGTLSFIEGVGASPAVGQLARDLTPCVPASGTNTGIAVNAIAASTGGATAANAWGYQL